MKKILIVDDSATMRKIIKRVLRLADDSATTVLEAANGIDFVKAVRTKHDKDSIPVVMITTEGGEAMLQTAMESGANGYVTKPFTPESIRVALEEIIG